VYSMATTVSLATRMVMRSVEPRAKPTRSKAAGI
jgi:hypothetical protein